MIDNLSLQAKREAARFKFANMYELLEKTNFLSNMPSEFLEANKDKFLQIRAAQLQLETESGGVQVDEQDTERTTEIKNGK